MGQPEELPAAAEPPAGSTTEPSSPPLVVVTGARFSYQLIEKWIDEYHKMNPDVQIVVESRGLADPPVYDILAEVYPHDEEISKSREYVYAGRYAILPVANSKSAFSSEYSSKGLNSEAIHQIFFEDIFADQEKRAGIKMPFTVYTRLQKAGVPTVFANYFGYNQRDIRGHAIAGADAHLIKALLRDSTGVTYLPLPLIYDPGTREPVEGLTVLPVDANGNRKVSDEEKFYENLDEVIAQLESGNARIKNIPVGYLHLSVDKDHASVEAINFLRWVNENGLRYLNEFGFLQPETRHPDRESFNEFASKRGID